MLLLLLVPVLFLVTRAHRYVQLYAPSNAVIVRARSGSLRRRAGLQLATCSVTALIAMHLLAEAVAAGAPAWLNLGVLILAWDAIKLGMAAAAVAVRRGTPAEAGAQGFRTGASSAFTTRRVAGGQDERTQ